MNLRVGIVGLPNAGKSTLFNALLKKQVAEAANYPFTTIEPNVGVVSVPDPRLNTLAQITREEEYMDKFPPIVPAVVQFIDIAGLVKGASQGQGLGNKFLAHIREVDLIVNVLRFFEDPAVVHVAGEVDPKRDREIIETELALADLQTLARQVEPKMNATKEDRERWEVILRLREGLNDGKLARAVVTDQEEIALIGDLHLLTMKPILYIANVSENQLLEGVIPAKAGISGGIPYRARLADASAKRVGNDMLPISAKIESELASLSSEEQAAYLKELGLDASGLDRLIKKAYEMLGLISFLTCGVIEARAWTLRRGETALRASGEIHTDFMKKFIKADVIPFDEFVVAGGWKKAREGGKVRSEGKEYIVKDGDVVEFKIGN